MPAALMPFVPQPRRGVSGVRFELGQIQPEPVPPPSYRPWDEPIGEIPHVSMVPRPCPDCLDSFKPRAWNQIRCRPCGTAYRIKTATARKLTARTRRSAPRVRCPAAEKAMATRKVNQATRDRAQRARQRSAA